MTTVCPSQERFVPIEEVDGGGLEKVEMRAGSKNYSIGGAISDKISDKVGPILSLKEPSRLLDASTELQFAGSLVSKMRLRPKITERGMPIEFNNSLF